MRFFSFLLLIFSFLVQPYHLVAQQKPVDHEAEQIEIAQKFVDRMFAEQDENSWRDFQMSDEMKTYLPSNTFNKWAKEIADDYGKPDRPEKIEVVRQKSGMHNVYMYCHCTRLPIKIWITFDGTTVSGFHWDRWNEEFEKQRRIETITGIAYTLFICIGLPIFCFLIIFVGENLRNRAVKRRLEELALFEFDPDTQETYRESQNPAWCYVLLLTIFVFCVFPLAFLPGIKGDMLLFMSIVLTVCLLPIVFVFGFFFSVDRQRIVVGMGLLRIPVLRIPLSSIRSVETMNFRPLLDFGGWGIRFGRKNTTGYFMSGNQGVLVTTDKGKKYLLGSDTPARLAKAIQSRLPKDD